MPIKPIPSKEPINPWMLGVILVVAGGVLWWLNKPKLTHAQNLAQAQEISKET